MSENFNLDSLFDVMENETKLTSVLYYPKKGDQVILAMLPPLQHQGEFKLAVPIETEYQGKVGKQFIVRFIMFNLVNGKPDTQNPKYVGIPLAPTLVQTLVKAYKGEYRLAVQECHFIELSKADKTVLTFRPTQKRIPDEIWNVGLTSPTWEELIEANLSMKQNVAAKANGGKKTEDTKEDTPW